MKNKALSLFRGGHRRAVFLLPLHVLAPLAFALAGHAPKAQAAGAMVTDDARIVDAKSCQLETWLKKTSTGKEYWALPACNPTGNLELTLGGARVTDPNGGRATDVSLQAKTLFKPLQTNDWGIGLAAGNLRHPATNTKSGRVDDPYVYVPVSFSFNDDRFVVHANLGWLRERETRCDRATWGFGSETQLAERTYVLAEVFGLGRDKPFYQVGLQFGIVPDRAQLMVTYGNRLGHGGEEHWYTVGLNLFSAPFQ